jgi:hypothetical protein
MSETRPPDKPDAPPPAGGFSWTKLKLPAVISSVLAALVLANQFFEAVPKLADGMLKTRDAIGRLIGRPAVPPPGPHPAAALTVDVRSLSVLPRSLANVMALQKPLHWLWVGAENRRADPLHYSIEAEISGPVISAGLIVADKQTVAPGGKLEHSIHVPIPMAKSDFKGDEILRVTWYVKDGPHLLWQKTTNIPVLPREVVPWGLLSAKGEPVSRELLVASLTAWVITPDPAIDERARAMLKIAGTEPDERVRARRFMAAAYEHLFAGPTPVRVNDRALRFPPRTDEAVKTPAGALKDRRATALEAALLLAAHRRALDRGDLRARVALLATPVSPQDLASKDFLLAWSLGGREWEAVDLRRAGTTAFEANRTAATERARPLLDDATLGKALVERGVFIDDEHQVIALAFRRAEEAYKIRPLP